MRVRRDDLESLEVREQVHLHKQVIHEGSILLGVGSFAVRALSSLVDERQSGAVRVVRVVQHRHSHCAFEHLFETDSYERLAIHVRAVVAVLLREDQKGLAQIPDRRHQELVVNEVHHHAYYKLLERSEQSCRRWMVFGVEVNEVAVHDRVGEMHSVLLSLVVSIKRWL